MNVNISKQTLIDNGYIIAAGLFSLSIWWFNTNNRMSLSILFSFLIGATVAYIIGVIVKAINDN